MVLNHVTQRTAIVIIGYARFQADGFRYGDLDVIDVVRVPDGLEQYVGKPQCEKVLNRLLAEIVIDAKNAVFAERLGYCIVYFFAR